MIRTRKYKPPLFYAAHEIAAAVPDNFYAQMKAALADQWEKLAEPLRAAFVEDWGRPTDPIVYLKCYVVGYCENIVFDTDLAERIGDSIAIREFLGYTLLERTPDHSSLSRVRGEVGESCVVEEVLTAAVAACAKEGLIGGTVAVVDASLVPANAALSSLRSISTGRTVREHLKQVRARNRVRGEGEKKEPETLSNADFVSDTDPDAKIARKPKQRRGLYYRATHVTDGQDQVIVGAAGGTAEVGEAEAAKEPVTQAQQNLAEQELSLSKVPADAGYDDADFHAHVEGLGGTPVTHTQKEGSQKPEGFRKSNFTYLPEEDCYRCPTDKLLPLCKHHQDRIEYRADARDCQACAHREACVGETKAQSRSLWRVANEASRERNTARAVGEEGKALLKLRGQIVEAPFGHMKTYGGVRLINCRGKKKAHVKVVLAAVAWDLLKVVKARCQALFAKATPAPAAAGAGVEAGPGAAREAASGAGAAPTGADAGAATRGALPKASSSAWFPPQTPCRQHLADLDSFWLRSVPGAILRFNPLLR